MKVAVAQMDTRSGDFEATVASMLAYGRRAEATGTELLVFPSCALMGFDPAGLLSRPGYGADADDALARLAGGLTMPALVPFCLEVDGVLLRDVALVEGGRVRPLRLAGLLDQEGAGASADEPGRGLGAPAVTSVGGVDVGVALTPEDLDDFADGAADADVICYMPSEGYDTDDEASCLAPSVSDGCYQSHAADANAWIVAAGAVGGYDDAVFTGGSFVLAPWGELAAVAPSFTEALLAYDIRVLSEGPLEDPVAPVAYDRVRVLWEALVLALRDQVAKRSLAGVAVALDGCLCSSALAALAVDAVGPLRVSALVAAAGEARADARQLARNLRIREVDELGDRALEAASLALGDDSAALAGALVQARLGSIAAAGGLLALSSSDKTELAVGPGAQEAPTARCEAFAPLGDVYRSDVARLARLRNASAPSIPEGALRRMGVPAGLGLADVAPTDEQRLSRLDATLLAHVERAQGLDGLLELGTPPKLAQALVTRVRSLEATRRCGPSYPVVSACSLAEAASPVTDCWRDRVRGDADEKPAGIIDELLRRLSAGAQGEPANPGETDQCERTPDASLGEMLDYLRSIAPSAGGAAGPASRGGADELWSSGLFSDN